MKPTLTIFAALLLLTACRRSDTPPPADNDPFWASVPQLVHYDDSLRHYYFRFYPDPTARTLTVSADTVGNTWQYRFTYGAAGELLRVESREPNYGTRSVVLERSGNRLVISGYHPQPDTLTFTEDAGGNRQVALHGTAWGYTASGLVANGWRHAQFAVNAAGQLVSYEEQTGGGVGGQASQLQRNYVYTPSGLDSLHEDFDGGLPDGPGSRSVRVTARDHRVDAGLLAFYTGLHGSDLSWAAADLDLLPHLPIPLLTDYSLSERHQLEGGLAQSIRAVTTYRQSGGVFESTQLNAGTFDGQGRLRRLERRIAGWPAPPAVLRIDYP